MDRRRRDVRSWVDSNIHGALVGVSMKISEPGAPTHQTWRTDGQAGCDTCPDVGIGRHFERVGAQHDPPVALSEQSVVSDGEAYQILDGGS